MWEEYCVIASFVGEGPNQLSADSGDQVKVMNKNESGKKRKYKIMGGTLCVLIAKNPAISITNSPHQMS